MKTGDPTPESPLASVVVVTRNRASSLKRTLAALRTQDYPSYEVVVVDHSSTDDTAATAERYNARRVVCPLRDGISRCRQRGVEAARGEVVAMCDDDCVPIPEWLSHLVRRLLSEPDLGLLGGQVVNVGFPPAQQYKGRTKMVGPNGKLAFAPDPKEAEFFGNANLAYRKAAIEEIGGYDPFFHAGAEIDLALSFRRFGYRVDYEASAVVEHHFTGVDYKRGRLFYGGELMRIYRHLKHSPPEGLRAWLAFLGAETRFLSRELYRVGRGLASAIVRGRLHRWPALTRDLFNALFARLIIPWLWLRARRQAAASKHTV